MHAPEAACGELNENLNTLCSLLSLSQGAHADSNERSKVHLDRIWKQLREEDERHTSKRTVSEQAEAEREAVDAKATEEQAEQKEEEAQPAAEEAQPDAAEEAEQEEEQSDIIDAQVAAAEAQREKRSAEAGVSQQNSYLQQRLPSGTCQ